MTARNEVSVLIEPSNEIVTLLLTSEQATRASLDDTYLQQLVQKEVEKVKESESSSVSSPPLSCENDGSSSSKSLFIWTTSCVHLLLTLYEEHISDFSGGAKRHKTIWEEIARHMRNHDPTYTMNGAQCQSKLSGLKKTFKKIIDHNGTSGNDRITWPFFDRINEIFGSTGWVQPKAVASDAGPSAPPSPAVTVIKKRKLETIFEKYVQEVEEEKRLLKEETELQKTKRQQDKEEKFNKLLAMKERQHEEKMKMLQNLCEIVKKK